MSELLELIAVSLYLSPCTEEELSERDFLKNIAFFNIQRLVMWLEKDAIFYKGDVIFVKKSWAKKNLSGKGYSLDFSTKKEKEAIGMTDFAKQVLGV